MSKPESRSTRDVSSWFHRKARLQTLLGNCGDDEEEGLALDRILHTQSLNLKAERSVEIENLRFSDKDLTSFGPLAEAQFGTVELVNCRLDGRVYVRKRVSKKFALRNREQCSPQYERHILLRTLKLQSRSTSSWTPHILCAYQCSSFLNIVMEYASGGSLWDILESSEDGRLSALDLSWWAPQCVSAIDWLHTRAGFVHRDIKPHNFVVRRDASPRLLLIDFGSSAPLLKPQANGVQHVPRSHCLFPCGTCDYISPEILQAHEEALVALELSDGGLPSDIDDTDDEGESTLKGKKGKILQGDVGYGRETDWWSLGAMLYELSFGVAPFFANDIRQTYTRIMNHESNLVFDRKMPTPSTLVSLIKGLLTRHENRIGRYSADELRNHGYFKDVDWTNLFSRPPPPNLLLPEFTYSTPLSSPELEDDKSESSTDSSKPFAFSALFQSSTTTKPNSSSHADEQDPTSTPAFGRRSPSRGGSAKSAQRSVTSFIGFSWGPPKDAFDDATRIVPAEPASAEPGLCIPPPSVNDVTTAQNAPITPKRPSQGSVPPSTVRMTSVRRSAQSRPVSDREAMRALVNCVGQSARKRVLESGKKPKVLLPQFGFGAGGISSAALRDSLNNGRSRASSLSRDSPKIPTAAGGGVRKELRFDDTAPQIMPNLSYTNTFTTTLSNSATSGGPAPFIPPPYSASDSGTMSELDGPPSPSPSPRPGSAMSMLSMTRRSVTPTLSSTFLARMGAPSRSSSVPPNLGTRTRSGSLGSLSGGSGRKSNTNRQGHKARFASSPESSPKRDNVRVPVPSTPHPRARVDGAKTQEGRASRRVKFADSPDESDEDDVRVSRERLPTTPHPRAKKASAQEEREQEAHPRTRTQAVTATSAPARAVQFLNSPPTSPPRIGIGKLSMPLMASTSHPKSKSKSKEGDVHEKTRRSAKPPLETRSRPIPLPSRATSTPARPSSRRVNAMVDVDDVFSFEHIDTKEEDGEDDVTIRPEPPRMRRLVPDNEDTQEYTYRKETHDADTESLPDYDSIHHHPGIPRCWNPSPPSFFDHDRSEFDPGRPHTRECEMVSLDEMELRFKRLLTDIANVSLHIDEFASRVQ